MPWGDPIVEEVRNVRDAYVKRFNYDLDAIYRDLKAEERQSGRVVVPYPLRQEATVNPNERQTGENIAGIVMLGMLVVGDSRTDVMTAQVRRRSHEGKQFLNLTRRAR